jgi:CheY-like chemotaxis protein
MVATEMLKRHQHQVVIAKDGREATEAFKNEPFDLVLMDVQMPEMDGLEATEVIRQFEQGSDHTPIVAMTASAMKGDRERCLQAGMDNYLSKPIEADDLYEMISRYMPSDNTNNIAAVSTSTAGSASRAVETLTIMDVDAALQRIPGGRVGFEQMVPLFDQECDSMLTLIRDGISSDDAQLVQRGAHTIKGSASVFVAKPVVDAAFELEKIGHAGQLDDAQPSLEVLETLLAELRSALRSIVQSASE